MKETGVIYLISPLSQMNLMKHLLIVAKLIQDQVTWILRGGRGSGSNNSFCWILLRVIAPQILM